MVAISGALKHLRLDKETDWGTWAGSGYLYIPVLGDGYTVKGKNVVYDPETGIFGYRRGPFGLVTKDVSGELKCLLQLGYVEQLLDWGIKRGATYEAESYSAEFRDGVTAFRHTGLRVNTFTLAGSADSGELAATLALVGKAESIISTFDVPSVTGVVSTGYVDEDFIIFQDGDSLELPDGSAVGTITAFSLQVANNLTIGPAGSDNTIIYAGANRQVITGSINLLYENDTEAAKLRNFTTSSLDLNFLSAAVDVQITLPKIVYSEAPREGAPSATQMLTLNFEAEYDSTLEYAITYTVGAA